MFSSHFPPGFALAVKVLALGLGVAAACVGWRAARLWFDASKVQIEDTTPRTEVSYEDAPALGVLEAIVSVNATQAAYNKSADLNAGAARWTAWAAILGGAAAIVGAI